LNAIVSVNSTRLLCKSLFYLATLKVEFNFSLQQNKKLGRKRLQKKFQYVSICMWVVITSW
ncbi:MAG: hypothetical protein E7A27_00005, partial [Erysipelotrichaceae bacterium]|nr:hypothetical protein [Erysipelotrichaceae bacterium]